MLDSKHYDVWEVSTFGLHAIGIVSKADGGTWDQLDTLAAEAGFRIIEKPAPAVIAPQAAIPAETSGNACFWENHEST